MMGLAVCLSLMAVGVSLLLLFENVMDDDRI